MEFVRKDRGYEGPSFLLLRASDCEIDGWFLDQWDHLFRVAYTIAGNKVFNGISVTRELSEIRGKKINVKIVEV